MKIRLWLAGLLTAALAVAACLPVARAANELCDLAQQEATWNGSNIVLGVPVAGFTTFGLAGCTNGATVSYSIWNRTTGEQETATGTLNTGAGTITRNTVISSTGSAIPLGAGDEIEVGSSILSGDIETLQPLDGDLTSWAAITRAAGFDTFVASPTAANFASVVTGESYGLTDAELACLAGLTSAADKAPYFTGAGTCATFDLSSAERAWLTTPSVGNLATVLTDEATGWATFQTTPTSANLRAFLTDEIGTGVAVFLGTPADDQVPVGDSASATTWRTVPDSDGATQKLQYDQATNTFSAGTDDDVPDAADFSNLTGGTGITNSPTGTINFDSTELTTNTWGANNYTTSVYSTDGIDLTIDWSTTDGLALLSGGGSAPGFGIDDQGALRLFEEDANGSNYVEFVSPTSLAANRQCILQDSGPPIPDSCVGDGTDGGGAGSLPGDPNVDAILAWDDVAGASEWWGVGTGLDLNVAGSSVDLDFTEINSLTWGNGSFTTMTFDAGATDPVFTAGSASISWTALSAFEIDHTGTLTFEIDSADAGAAGPVFKCQHDSASPADGDIACDWQVFAGDDDEQVGRIAYELDDGATTTEDGRWRIFTDQAGSELVAVTIGNGGMIVGNASTTLPATGFARLSGIELGSDTDTTLARSAAGEATIEGRPILSRMSAQVLTSGTAATYTPTSGSKFFKVTCTGGGGGGGGSDSDGSGAGAGGGGRGGGTAVIWYDSTEMGASATYTIGPLGGGGSATNGTNGTAGTDTTFDPAGTGLTITGAGGGGGTGSGAVTTDSNTAAGSSTGGGTTNADLGINSNGGYAGVAGLEASGSVPFALGGAGGGTAWGQGGRQVALVATGNTAGPAATVAGGGGSGGVTVDSTTGAAGGNGGDGICVVEEFG